ncbi:MAG: flagellar export protein FliJ [Thermodesulfovibrionales bacterium]|nr:flagellar export protein FliJ [Thermodesulfovibrionales bacterium]
MASTIQSLLGLKQWQEDEAKNAFAQALKSLSAEEDILRALEDKLNSLKKDFINLSSRDTDIDSLKSILDYQEYLIYKISMQRDVISKKEIEVEEARKKLVEATKERRIFERLREKEILQIQKQQERLERIQTDETTSVRFGRSEE